PPLRLRFDDHIDRIALRAIRDENLRRTDDVPGKPTSVRELRIDSYSHHRGIAHAPCRAGSEGAIRGGANIGTCASHYVEGDAEFWNDLEPNGVGIRDKKRVCVALLPGGRGHGDGALPHAANDSGRPSHVNPRRDRVGAEHEDGWTGELPRCPTFGERE